jgi:hypothetical protein
MSSLTRRLEDVKVRELPYELKYNCLRHLNDELLKRLAEANQLIEQFKVQLNGRTQEETGREQEGSETSDGLRLECGGQDEEESLRETAATKEAQNDKRAMRGRVYDAYVETD